MHGRVREAGDAVVLACDIRSVHPGPCQPEYDEMIAKREKDPQCTGSVPVDLISDLSVLCVNGSRTML